MQENSVTNQQPNTNGQNPVSNNNQVNGGVSTPSTNYINNISAVAANNRQANMNNNVQGNQPLANNMANINNPNMAYGQGYVEPPKKKNSTLTFIVIFLILAVAAIGGYFVGGYIFDATHQTTTE
jgi:nitrate reductase NapE component